MVLTGLEIRKYQEWPGFSIIIYIIEGLLIVVETNSNLVGHSTYSIDTDLRIPPLQDMPYSFAT